MLTCKKCNEAKGTEFFHVDKTRSNGYHPYCKLCRVEYTTKYANGSRKTPEGKARAIAAHRKREYGVTEEQYNKLLNEQGGCCAICGQQEKSIKKVSLAVDHNHRSGKIRGLLCDTCNRGLGFFKDDPALLFKAIGYLAEGGVPS